jgi:hypothetical protein
MNVSPSLETFIERKTFHLEAQIKKLSVLQNEPPFSLDKYASQHITTIRKIAREITSIETLILPLIETWGDTEEKMQKVVDDIVKDANLALPYKTAVSLHSADYFYINEQDIIYLPRLEGHSLLHLADLYHEIAHHLLREKDNVMLSGFGMEIRNYFDEMQTRGALEDDPLSAEGAYLQVSDLWQKFWYIEFACDMIATYFCGPAYAMAHLHLCTLKFTSIYNPNIKSIIYRPIDEIYTHPANEARWRAIDLVLQDLGLKEEAQYARQEWDKLVNTLRDKEPVNFDRMYPSELLVKLQTQLKRDLLTLNAAIYNPQSPKKNTFAEQLNRAWDAFWKAPSAYVQWEQENWSRII